MFRCNVNDMKQFQTGKVWQDLCQELEEWEQSIRADLEEPSYNPMKDAMRFPKAERALYDEYLRGCLLAVRRFRQLPDMIAQMILENNEQQPSTISEDQDG